jgi:hypothetical protein
MAQFVVNAGRHDPYKNFKSLVEWDGEYEAGQVVLAYKVYRCWVSEYQALPDLDADAVAFESLTLQHEGWERDTAAPEPKEPAG